MEQRSLELFGVKINTRFSTVDEYLIQLEKENYLYDTYVGDFLPLIDDVDPLNKNSHALDYWTGFYSNKPNFKS